MTDHVPQSIEEFNSLNEMIYEDNLVAQLTNYRHLKGKQPQVKQVVLSGYLKQMSMINNMLMKSSLQRK